MTILASRFKTAAQAACIVAALGATALIATPAMAQEGPAFNFSLQLPGGVSVGADQGPATFGQRQGPNRGGDYGDRGRDHRYQCLSDREIQRGLGAYGFSRVEITRQSRRDRVEVVGLYGNWLYSMRVDKCTGDVDRVERIRRVRGGGFGLQFNFGN